MKRYVSLKLVDFKAKNEHELTRDDRIEYSKVANGVDSHSDRVLGENFLRWNVKSNRSQVHFEMLVDAGQHKEDARTFNQEKKTTFFSLFQFLNS